MYAYPKAHQCGGKRNQLGGYMQGANKPGNINFCAGAMSKGAILLSAV